MSKFTKGEGGKRLLMCCLMTITLLLPALSGMAATRHMRVLFYDKNGLRNGAYTMHMWSQTPEGEWKANYTEWNSRPQMKFTGKSINVDGVECPVYEVTADWDDSRYDPTHLLFTREHYQDGKTVRQQTADYRLPSLNTSSNICYEGTYDVIYGFDGEKYSGPNQLEIISSERMDGYTFYKFAYAPEVKAEVTEQPTEGEGDDLGEGSEEGDGEETPEAPKMLNFHMDSMLHQMPDVKKYTIYFANKIDRYNYEYWSSDYTYVHMWGDNGDLRPWNYNESMSYFYTPDNDYYLYYDGENYQSLYSKYEFYYAGTPDQVIFHYYDGSSTPAVDVVDGAIYEFDKRNKTVRIITEPEMVDEWPVINGSIYVIDTDHWSVVNEYTLSGSVYQDTTVDYNIMMLHASDDSNYYTKWDSSDGVMYVEMNGRVYRIYKLDLNWESDYDPGHMANYNLGKISKFRLGNSRDFDKKTRRTTGVLPFVDGGVYYYGGNDVVTPVGKIEDFELFHGKDVEHKDQYVYVHLGANQIMQDGLWDTPYCKPFKRTYPHAVTTPSYYNSLSNVYEYLPEDEAECNAYLASIEEYKMEPVPGMPGYYRYLIKDINTYDDFACFYYSPEWGEVMQWDEDGGPMYDEYGNYLTTWEETGYIRIAELTASRSPYFDPTQLNDYVYDIGVDCFHQSYLSVEDFEKISADFSEGNVPAVYLVGNEPVTGTANTDPYYSTEIKNEHGGFYIDFEVLQAQPASFKVSTVDVKKFFDQNMKSQGFGDDYYHWQRGWASYNLGMIGPHKDVNDPDYKTWYDEHIFSGASSREIRVFTDELYDYNNYCQYPWRVEVSDDHGIQEGHYWMVVDILPEDKSVTLLDFDPHPKFHFKNITVRVENLENQTDDIDELHSYSDASLSAAAHNGDVKFNKAYVAKGEITVGDTDPEIFKMEGFDVTYTLTIDGEQVLKTQEAVVDNSVFVDHLDVSDQADITLRGRFVKESTGKAFTTAYTCSDIQFEHNAITAPTMPTTDGVVCAYYTGEHGDLENVAVGGFINVDVSNYNPYIHEEAGELYGGPVYADYTVDGITVDDEPLGDAYVPLVHRNHKVHETIKGMRYLNDQDDEEGEFPAWQPWNGSDEYDDAMHNWSNHIVRTKFMPLVIEDLYAFDSEVDRSGTKVKANVSAHAVYPFLVYRYEKKIEVNDGDENTPAAAPRRAEAADKQYGNTEKYRIVNLTKTSTMPVELVNDMYVGIDNVIRDEENSQAASELPAVYYNLEGMRVSGDLVPGIYIERRGNQTRKILVN